MTQALESSVAERTRYGDRPARDALAALWRLWRRERAFRRSLGTLEALDDHMLRDIGLDRHDLGRAVRRGCPNR